MILRAISSVGQSSRLITGRSGVQVPDGPPQFHFIHGGVPERPKGADCKSVVNDFDGSNPSSPTMKNRLSRETILFNKICRCDGIGRRVALKMRWRNLRAGSRPATGTIKTPD